MLKKMFFLVLIMFVFFSCKSKYHGLSEKKLNKELFKAVAKEDYKLIKILLKEGADINTIDSYGVLPMMIAIEKKNIKTIKFLVKNGAVFLVKNKTTSRMESILAKTIITGDFKLVKILIELGADPLAKFFFVANDSTTLMAAVYANNIEMVKYFIGLGVKIDARDEYGDPAINWATFFTNNEEIVKLLIEKGCDLNMLGYDRRTALDHAMHRDNPSKEIIKILKEAGAKSAKEL